MEQKHPHTKTLGGRARFAGNWEHVRGYGVITLAMFALGLSLLSCSDDDGPTSPLETITAPSAPTGPTKTTAGKTETYSTGSANSSVGHSLEYRLDWGDGNRSPWSCYTGASYSWSTEGGFAVKAQARCKTHTDKMSLWSGEQTVAVGEAISVPHAPTGPYRTDVGTTEIYSTGGSTSSSGHSVEYRFDWGDGNASPWSASASASHSWSAEGDYSIKAQSRCAVHTDKESPWSAGQIVSVGETVSAPDPPLGQPVSRPGNAKVYCSGGAASSRGHEVLYQFDWEAIAIPLWTSSSCVSIYWSAAGHYLVRARARCADHPEAVSRWSDPFVVDVTTHEVITTPMTPTGPSDADVGYVVTYSTGGAISSHDHGVEYRFDWGNGSQSPWATSGNSSHTWTAAGVYDVKAQARCRTHTARISPWSSALTVTVTIP